MEMPTWLISVLGGIGGALLTLITTLIVNHVSYKHEYYRMIIEKRMKTYNNIESLVSSINKKSEKLPQTINKNNVELLKPFEEEIESADIEVLWLSNNMKMALDSLKEAFLIVRITCYDDELQKIVGKYDLRQSIANNKKWIEKAMKEDLMSMYEVRRFLKNKK